MKRAIMIILLAGILIPLSAQNLKISPVLECVDDNGDGTYTAHFGYYNRNSVPVNIPIGSNNRFTGTPDIDAGQPTLFQSGRIVDDFQVEFDGSNIVWTLRSPNGQQATATASSGSQACPRNDDDDDDGVSNDDDAFPDDPDRAYITWYPAGADNWGSLLYEDKWPSMGDFDFNDIVVEYNVKEITNANSELVDIEMYFRLAAIGASYHNGFGVELPIETSNVQIWESDLTAAELESGGTNATFVLFNDAFDLISQPEWSFVNTLQEEAYQEPYEFMLSLTLTSYIPVSSLEWEAPYNPFIFVNQERGKEVHVTGYPGTWQVDPSYFQTEDDNTVPGSSYYKTADNLPFGLMIPEPFLYPLERVDITDAYYFLGDWAESGGTRHTDWYVTDPENVDLNEVYQSSE